MLYDFIYTRYLTHITHIHRSREQNGGFQGLWGNGNGELLFNGIEVQSCKMNFWKSALYQCTLHLNVC